MTIWLVIPVALLLALLTGYVVFTTEGAYFGKWAVAALYDLAAPYYDRLKGLEPELEALILGRPLVEATSGLGHPLVLDVATGTGRLPLALLEQPDFNGRVICLDISIGMLRQAAFNLRRYGTRVELIRHSAEPLPFPDDVFDLVTCLEALEFMPSPRRTLAELTRVLRPGGLLLTTLRIGWEARLLPGKALKVDELADLLESLGMEGITFTAWQAAYDLVWAIKRGHPRPGQGGVRPLAEVLLCPVCGEAEWESAWTCGRCGSRFDTSPDGILLMEGRCHRWPLRAGRPRPVAR